MTLWKTNPYKSLSIPTNQPTMEQWKFYVGFLFFGWIFFWLRPKTTFKTTNKLGKIRWLNGWMDGESAGAQYNNCPDASNCVGPGGTIYSPAAQLTSVGAVFSWWVGDEWSLLNRKPYGNLIERDWGGPWTFGTYIHVDLLRLLLFHLVKRMMTLGKTHAPTHAHKCLFIYI